jgi:hypothetical protein
MSATARSTCTSSTSSWSEPDPAFWPEGASRWHSFTGERRTLMPMRGRYERGARRLLSGFSHKDCVEWSVVHPPRAGTVLRQLGRAPRSSSRVRPDGFNHRGRRAATHTPGSRSFRGVWEATGVRDHLSDITQLHVAVLGVTAQHLEGMVCVEGVALHQDALRLADELA